MADIKEICTTQIEVVDSDFSHGVPKDEEELATVHSWTPEEERKLVYVHLQTCQI